MYRAYLGLQIEPADASGVVLGFKSGPYRAKSLEVRCNNGPVHRWVFRGRRIPDSFPASRHA